MNTRYIIIDFKKLHSLMCNATGGSSGLRDKAALESAIYHSYTLNRRI